MSRSVAWACAFLALTCTLHAGAGDALKIPKSRLIEPATLAAELKGPRAARPTVFQVGFRTLYQEAHIPGSVYAGPARDAAGRAVLAARLRRLPKDAAIVLYCGCCPWDRCPNVDAAYREARSLGYRRVRVLHLESDFGTDWVDPGFPVATDGPR